MFKLTYIKLCYYLIMIRFATFFYQSRSAQIVLINNLGSFTLYSSASITPKMHFLTHLTTQMENFGPLRHQACLRF
jgi:hypothetical protein